MGDDEIRSQQEADAALEFEPHVVRRGGKLEPHRVAIGKMRERRWPYRKVAAWLLEERNVRVNAESVRRFCSRRGIYKGVGEAREDRPHQPRRPRRTAQAAAMPKPAPKADDDEWDLVVPKSLSTWKSRGEERPPPRRRAEEKEEFDFDETKPLQTWKSRGDGRKA